MRSGILIIVFIFLCYALKAQYVYTITADSVRLTGPDSSELILENHTQGIPGFLFNTGRGRTQFRRALLQLDDSTFLIGVDTLHTLRLGSLWAPNGAAIYNTNPGNVGINQPNPAMTLDIGGLINVTDTGHYDLGGQPVLQDSAAILQVGLGSGSFASYSGLKSNTLIGEGAGLGDTINGSTVLVGTDAGAFGSGQLNTALGAQAGNSALGDNNLFGGYSAGEAATGSQNTYLGSSAGFSTNGNYNTSAGYNSAYILQGTDNSILGNNAASQPTGNANVYLGDNVGINVKGNANTYVGFRAGGSASGSNNVSIGQYTSWNVTSGSHNLYMGDSVGGANVGNFNTWLGTWAGNAVDTGSGIRRRLRTLSTPANELDGVTLLGSRTMANNTTLSDATAVGYGAIVSTSNTMVFGDSAVSTWLFNSNAPAVSGKPLLVGNNASNGNGAYLSAGGVWANASDRDKKENFQRMDQNDLLARIDQLPVTQWNYKGLHDQHIGPVAQDFYRIFDVGSNDKTISTIDPSGIALAGIQGLLRQIQDQQAEIESLREILRLAKQKLNTLKTSLQ